MKTNLTTDNFYEYLNKKYNNINHKINKKLNQAGGTNVLPKLQMDLAHLEALKNILKKKVDTGDKIDFEKIASPLRGLVDDLGDFARKINEKLEVTSDINKDLLINQMGEVQKFITQGQDNYLNIRLKNMPALVHPPIAIPAINDSNERILEFIEKNMKELLEYIKTKNNASSVEFREKMEKIKLTLANLVAKTSYLLEATNEVKSKIKEINDYTLFDLQVGTDIKPEFFYPVELAQSEMISVDKLESATILTPGKTALDASEQFDKIFEGIKIDEKLLIKPDYMRLANENLVGGNNMYLYSNKDVKKVMDEVLNKWMAKINEIKKRIAEDLEIKRIEATPTEDPKPLIDSFDKFKNEKLVNLRENIGKLVEIINQVKKLSNDFEANIGINCLISKPEIRNELVELEQLVRKINSFINELNTKIDGIKNRDLSKPLITKGLFEKLEKETVDINQEIVNKMEEINIKLGLNTLDNFNKECTAVVSNSAKDIINRFMNFIIGLVKNNIDEYVKQLLLERLILSFNFEVLLIKQEKKSINTTYLKLDLLNKKIKTENLDKNDTRYSFNNEYTINQIENLINQLSYTDKINLILGIFAIDYKYIDIYGVRLPNLNVQFGLSIPSQNITKNKLLDLLSGNLKTKISNQLIINLMTSFIKPYLSTTITKKEIEGLIVNKVNQIKKIKAIEDSLELVGGFYNQSGGLIEDWENYYFAIVDMYMKVNSYKSYYNEFKKIAREFNIGYIQLYNHQLYISNYIQIVLLGETYQIYEFVSRGTVNFYRSIINTLYQKCNDPKTVETDKVIRYFYKYHYITIKLLYNFLNDLRIKWSVDFKFATEKSSLIGSTNRSDEIEVETNKNLSRLQVITDSPDKIHTDKMKKGLFMLNLFKDILDSYSLALASPVAVYLRINDWSNPSDIVFKKDPATPEKLIKQNHLEKCNPGTIGTISQKTPQNIITDLPKYIDNLEKIKFNEIFDPEGFGSNEILAMYMNIPNYLAKGQSIMMITYGYSGVGKTFTLFGRNKQKDDGTREVKQGILQKALQSIQNKKQIFMRTYEIYGKALPYKSYWKNRNTEDYNHLIYAYKLLENMETEVNPYEKTDMTEYLKKIKNNNSDGYDLINDFQIQTFDTFVGNIDNIRKNEGRIKKTVNNPESSRSIMVYEFKVELNDKKFVRFVVMDLPGKEDIKSSYVYPNKTVKEMQDEFCINLKSDILQDITGQKYLESAVRASIFSNPIFISIFPTIAKKLVEYFNNNKTSIVGNDKLEDFMVTTINTKEGISTLNNTPLTDLLRNNEFSNRLKKRPSLDETKFGNCLKASEIMRYLIEKNKLDTIINFYESESESGILDNNKTKCKNAGALPFEGFYINENILGLVNTLRTRLNRNFKPDEKDLMGNFFSNNMPPKMVDDTNIFANEKNGETVAQTYFIRDLLRNELEKGRETYLIDDTGNHLITNETNYNSNYLNKSIKSWIEDSYDFNKSYTEKPPIATFMEAYFSTFDDSTSSGPKYVINNFYLFYVVSNNDPGRCANQIKLINDSKNFIDAIQKYVPDTEAPETPKLSELGFSGASTVAQAVTKLRNIPNTSVASTSGLTNEQRQSTPVLRPTPPPDQTVRQTPRRK